MYAFPDNRKENCNSGIYSFRYIYDHGMNESDTGLSDCDTLRYRYIEGKT
ncbi:MAG: hypothetical protein J6X60_05565 [Ruminiclostridium sp.]|nr:hypothetical protein [Ruminiclostridium sp.]